MAYTYRIKTLEESFNIVEAQISNMQWSGNIDQDKMQKLKEARDKYLEELRLLRKAQYDESQSVDFDDDR